MKPGGPVLDCPGPSGWGHVVVRVLVYGGWVAALWFAIEWLRQPVPS